MVIGRTALGPVSDKCKAILLTGREGLWRCEMLKIPHCLDNRLTDGGKAVSTGQNLLPRNIIFLPLVFISVRG
jgi:hypothetical protein